MEQTKAITVEEIKPYILEKSKVNGLDWYHYLHIRGGSGGNPRQKYRLGGEYHIILFYASPDEMKGLDCCERRWCLNNNITFGEGYTILEAYQDYLNKKDGKNG